MFRKIRRGCRKRFLQIILQGFYRVMNKNFTKKEVRHLETETIIFNIGVILSFSSAKGG